MQRIILHIDLDTFFASCEAKRNPSLEGKPVVIVIYTRSNTSGAVSTASYEARALGIKSGMPLFQAKRLADEETVFLKADIEYYEKVSERIMSILKAFADKFEQLSIDEAFLDVSMACNHSFENALSLAKTIQEKILEEERLKCSIGISFNKLLAKMATDAAKPNGIKIVRPADIESFLDSLPARKLIGVGIKTAEALKRINVETISDLKKLEASRLIELFGKKKGLFLFESARGIDESPVEEVTEIQQVSRIRTLDNDTNNFNVLNAFLEKLLRQLFIDISLKKLSFKTITLTFVKSDLTIHTKSKTLDFYINSFDLALSTAKILLKDFLLENPEKIRRLGISLKNLQEETPQKSITDFF